MGAVRTFLNGMLTMVQFYQQQLISTVIYPLERRLNFLIINIELSILYRKCKKNKFDQIIHPSVREVTKLSGIGDICEIQHDGT